MFHRVEVTLGLLTHALAMVGVALAVFGPATFSYGTNSFDAASVSVWDQGLDAAVVIYLVALLIASLAVVAGAYLRVQGRELPGTISLWAGTLVLIVGAALTLPGSSTAIVPSALHTDTGDSVGIGIYFVPAALMALGTAVTSMAIHHTPGRSIAAHSH